MPMNNRFFYTSHSGRKVRIFTSVLLFSLMSVCAFAQQSRTINQAKKNSVDSLLEVGERKDADNLSDLKSDRADTRAKAKEAQRVERNVNDAAREANAAYRDEQKAQKARKKADRQAKKAAKARMRSDKD
jgi:hypothetical protein